MSCIYPYAGFWRRVAALLIDSLVIAAPATVFYAIIMSLQAIRLSAAKETDAAAAFLFIGTILLSQLILLVAFWLYFALMESGSKQATLGKRAMGIKVVGADGGRISFARATGRFFAKTISHMLLNFGYLMAGFTKKRQALHDLMADTYVVREDFQPGQEKPVLEFSTGGLIASILATLLPVLFYILLILIGIVMMALSADTKFSPDSANYSSQAKRQVLAAQAKAKMSLLSLENDLNKTQLPKTEEGITLSKTGAGYRAEFKDDEGNRFVFLNQTGKYFDTCCAEGNCELLDEKKCN